MWPSSFGRYEAGFALLSLAAAVMGGLCVMRAVSAAAFERALAASFCGAHGFALGQCSHCFAALALALLALSAVLARISAAPALQLARARRR